MAEIEVALPHMDNNPNQKERKIKAKYFNC